MLHRLARMFDNQETGFEILFEIVIKNLKVRCKKMRISVENSPCEQSKKPLPVCVNLKYSI